MSRRFKSVRHSGCRSPLMLTLFIVLFLVVFMLFKIPEIFPTNNIELQEFLQLINQEYNEDIFNYNNISEQDYNALETKVINTATNSNKPLISNNTLIIDNFVSTDTTLNKQLILNGKDIACLLNLTMEQSTQSSETINITDAISVNTFSLSTQQGITTFSGI